MTAGPDAWDPREARVAVAAMASVSLARPAGGALVLSTPEAPGVPMLNRVVGLGVERPAVEADVDEALGTVERGVTFYVAVAPGARPADLPAWLQRRGLEASWGWAAFRRSVARPPEGQTTLRLAEVAGPGEARAFARVVRLAYELPEALEPRIATAPEAGWTCWLALDADEPAAAAALFAADRVGYLGFAATLPHHRGKGAQSGLLTARIRRAATLGCDVVITETGERRGDRPSDSYRNILRAGFQELAVTANWLGRT